MMVNNEATYTKLICEVQAETAKASTSFAIDFLLTRRSPQGTAIFQPASASPPAYAKTSFHTSSPLHIFHLLRAHSSIPQHRHSFKPIDSLVIVPLMSSMQYEDLL